jgi:ABC-2 type transport system permease protein
VAAALAGFGAFAAVFQAVAKADILVALIAGALAFVAASLWLLRWPLRGRSSRIRSLAVLGSELVLLAATVSVVAMGGLGFSAWVPDATAVAKVEVSYVGTPSYLGIPYTGTASNSAYYLHAGYVFDAKSDASAIEVAREAHLKLLAEAQVPLDRNEEGFLETVVPYDIVLRYTLIDGSEAVRYFDRAAIGTLEKLLALDESQRVRDLQRAVITGDVSGLDEESVLAVRSSQAALAYQAGNVYLADANYNVIVALPLDAPGRASLLKALAADVAAQNVLERYTQPEQVFGTLLFTNSPATDREGMGFSFSSAVVPLAPGFVQTRQWLVDAGMLAVKPGGVDPALIEEMTFMPDDPYASVVARQGGGMPAPASRFFIASRSSVPGRFWAVSDFGSLKATADADRITQLAPRLRTACFMGGGYFVQAKLRGIEAYVYYYLPESEAPAFVKGGGM